MLTKYFRIKQLAKLMNIKTPNLLKDITIKHRNKFYCRFDDMFFEFPSAKDIIIPESIANACIKKAGKNSKLRKSVDILMSPSSHLEPQNTYSIDRMPVVAILGHVRR